MSQNFPRFGHERALLVIALCGLVAGAALALAAEPVEVRQAGRHFAPDRLKLKRGTAVDFINDEDVVHHAFVTTPAFSADTGDISPGESKRIVFDRIGKFDVRCAIHPQMALAVEVTE